MEVNALFSDRTALPRVSRYLVWHKRKHVQTGICYLVPLCRLKIVAERFSILKNLSSQFLNYAPIVSGGHYKYPKEDYGLSKAGFLRAIALF